MPAHLDHITIPAKDKSAAAQRLAEIFNVSWGPARFGPFVAVHVVYWAEPDGHVWELLTQSYARPSEQR